MDELTEPEGDPHTIRGRAASWKRLTGGLADEKSASATGVATAVQHWRGRRKVAFTDAADGLGDRLDRVQAVLEGGAGAIERYASALEEAQAAVRRLRDRATECDDRIAAARTKDPLTAEVEVAEARSDRNRLVHLALDEHDEMARAARRAAHDVEAAVDFLVPGGAGLSPDALRQRVHLATGAGGLTAALASGTLTSAQAWAALESLRTATPTPDWRLAAVAYGLDFPASMDRGRGLALKARLDQVLETALSLAPDARARLIRQFADSLPEADRLTLAYFDRMRVGNLDGIPNTVRYVANRFNVADGLASERVHLAAMVREFGSGGPGTDDPAYVEFVRLNQRIKVLGELLSGARLSGDTEANGAYQVLAFQPPRYDGFRVVDDGRLAVVIGDLDRAAHVGVVVPGITNRIDNFDATYDKAENTQGIAHDSATIAWLGYDTPEFADSVTTDDAETGGAALAVFLQGLQRAKDSDLTIMAHSYGTLATSKALQAISRNHWKLPDRVVLFGSPGLGENVHTTADLGLPPGYPIYALRAPGDPVAITAAHGTDPCEIPGITQLDTQWRSNQVPISGHSSYTKRRSGALFNLAGVLEGWPPGDASQSLRVGGDPLSAGFAGAYNVNVRNLVDLLQDQVDARTLSRFIGSIESDAELVLTTKSVDDPSILIAKVWAAAHTSGLTTELTQHELQRAVEEAGFTTTLGHQTDDAVTRWVRDADGLDGLPLPVPGPAGILFHPHVPRGANELLAGPLGDASGFLTQHAADMAVEHLPSLSTVLGAAETIAVPYDMAQWVHNQKDVAADAWDTGTGFASDRWEDGKEAADWVLGKVGLG